MDDGDLAQGSAEALGKVCVVAGRIRRFAESVQQAHGFDIGPGDNSVPWSLSFQQAAVGAYTVTLPWPYLVSLARRFEESADLMVTLSAPSSIGSEWSRIQQYLRSAAEAIRLACPAEIDRTAPDRPLETTTPSVMPFSLIAERMSQEGAAQLRHAGGVVESACGSQDESPLTEQEVQWLRALAGGERTIDIATASGYSERSLYRILGNLWDRLNVAGRREGLVLAARNNWI